MAVGSTFDQELGALLIRGSQEDIREFVILAGPLIYSYLNRIGVSPADRDDLYQEVLIKVINFRERLDSDKRITSWLFTVTVNLTRSRFRAKREYCSITDLEEETSTVPDSFQMLVGKQLVERIENLMGLLPLAQREAILICGFEQIDQKQAATILNIPETTLRTNLRRGRIKLAEELAKLEAEDSTRVII